MVRIKRGIITDLQAGNNAKPTPTSPRLLVAGIQGGELDSKRKSEDKSLLLFHGLVLLPDVRLRSRVAATFGRNVTHHQYTGRKL